jgi:hypothetical protein
VAQEGSMRRAANKDVNHDVIVNAFRGRGCSWWDTFRLGDDEPDGVAGVDGVNVLVEIKRDDDGPKHGSLTEGQEKWHQDWRGWVVTVRNVVDVGHVVTMMKAISPRREP